MGRGGWHPAAEIGHLLPHGADAHGPQAAARGPEGPRVEIRRHFDARAFLDRAEDWLLENEARNNLILAIAGQLLRADHPFQNPIYLATIEDEDRVVGCAWRTPPFKLGLTPLPIGAVRDLAADVATLYDRIPAVLGPEPQALEFAKCWSRQTGVAYVPGMRQGIYGLEQVHPPERLAAGALRRAELADLPLISEWSAGFSRDVGMPDHQLPVDLERAIESGGYFLWQDGEPRSMALATGRTRNGIRIGTVYTPPHFRSRGYATAAVGSLSQLLLDAGHRFCFLYTDLSNPTSNKIYQQVGYVRVGDCIDVLFC
jgi:predicted GNAT family acetyltransferase